MEDLNTSDTGTPDATISSANTSLSGLTGYEEEFNDLRLLIHPTSPKQYITSPHRSNDTSKLLYETTIKSFSSQLDNTLKLNEKLRNELLSKEKVYEEENRKRVNSLITRIAQLEAQLTAVRCHIEGLLKQCCTDESTVFETSCLNVYEQIKLIQNEIVKCNSEKNTNAVRIRNIKSELEVAKEEIQTRIACVNELKRKVSEQYTNIENVSQYNKELESKLKSANNDMDWYKKCEDWYKQQLQNERTKSMITSQDIIKLQQTLFEKDQQINQLNLGINKWRHQYEELQVLQKKERDGFLKKIEELQFFIINNEPANNQINEKVFCPYCKEKEMSIQCIKDEMDLIKMNAQNHRKLYEETEKEKLNLNEKLLRLEKNINEKELMVHHLEQQNIALQNEIAAKEVQKQQNSFKEILNLTELNHALKAKVAALTQEKVEVENAVNLIRQDLSKFVVAHTQLKNDVTQKDSVISKLQTEIQALAAMQNNEREKEKFDEQKLKNSSDLEITQLKSTVALLEGTISELENKCEAIALEKGTFIETIQRNSFDMQQKYEKCLEEEQLKRVATEEINNQFRISLEEKEALIQSLQSEKVTMNEEIYHLNNQLLFRKTQTEKCCDVNRAFVSNSPKDLYVESSEVKVSSHQDDIIVEILELVTDKLQKMETNVLCKEDINIELKILSPESKPFLLLRNIMQSLLRIHMQMKKSLENGLNQSIQEVVSNFSDYLLNKMHAISDQCNTFQRRAEKCYQTVNVFKQKLTTNKLEPAEEIIKLKTQQMELNEKLKRYEINNRTLLRKVKEHMKARNAAEKQIFQIQTLYNSLNDAYSVVEVELSNKKLELQQSDLLVSNLKSHIADLQASLFNVEKQMVEQKGKNDMINKLFEEKASEVDNCKDLLIKYENQILQLKDLNANLSETVKGFQIKLQFAENECLNLREELKNNNLNLVKTEDKLKEFETRCQLEFLETSPQNKNFNNTINKLETEVKRLNNDRWFLQRLCKDLKCALEASINEKQILKAQQSKGLHDFLDLSKRLPVPKRCNDTLIQKLLSQNQALQVPLTVIDKPLQQLKLDVNNLEQYVKKERCFSNIM